jgi:hypothetical protein
VTEVAGVAGGGAALGLGGGGEAELGGRGLAEGDEAGGEELGDGRRGGLGDEAAEGAGAHAGGDAGDVVEILDEAGDAAEGAGGGGVGVAQRRVEGARDDGLQVRLPGLGAGDGGLHGFAGADVAGGDARGGLDGVPVLAVHGHCLRAVCSGRGYSAMGAGGVTRCALRGARVSGGGA